MPSKSQPDEAAGRRRKTQFATKRAQDNVPKEQAEQRLTQLRAQRMSAMQQQRKEVKIVGDDNAAKAMKRRETRAAGALLPNSLSVGPKNYNNNCDANNEDMTIDDGMTEDQREEAKALEQHLIGISPFNGRWDVEKTISAGTFGVAFFVRDNLTNTQGVIKVARSAVGEASNTTAEWEGFILERIFKTNPSANIVRLLDKGMLEDQNGERLEFLGVELCHQTVREYIGEAANPEDRGYRVCRVALGSLKGIFDLHIQGILHRDIKPDNMGIINQVGNPVCVLYDLGMARLYTDCDGFLRPPRTVVPFRGTVEWSSGHAAKGRDQSRFDDLIGWFYVIVELFGPEFTANDLDPRPFPWNYCENHLKACRYLKSVYTPARLLLRHCPIQMYNVNMYLQCASRMKVPDYKWIANHMADAMADFKRKADALKKLEKQKKRSATTQEPDEHE